MSLKEPKASKLNPIADSSEEDGKKQKGVLYVGIDLGTSRTSVASSNGQRETVYSYVGYAKDYIAKKVLGRDVVFGKEAIEKRDRLDLIRPFENGMIKFTNEDTSGVSKEQVEKHLRAAKDLVKHALSLCKPRKDELLYHQPSRQTQSP